MSDTITVYASIGNSDDKLTQAEWAYFVDTFREAIDQHAETIHGEWHSLPNARYQNCCICFEVDEDDAATLTSRLAGLCRPYRQDSIAWATVMDTEFIKPSEARP